MLNRGLISFGVALVLVLMASVGNAAVTLTFDDLLEGEYVGDYYNSGYGYDYITGVPQSGLGPNYGIIFNNIWTSKCSYSGGGGDFTGGEPSPHNTILFYQNDQWMDIRGGFSKSLSFYYFNPNGLSKIYLYSGLNKTGNIVAILDLPMTAPTTTGKSRFQFATVKFSGTVKSVDFCEMNGYVDNITLGSLKVLKTPVANAGPNQTVYAEPFPWNIAWVTFNGSRSCPNSQALTYKWNSVDWIYGITSEEVNPTIYLDTGVHWMKLVVNDGVNDSAPDYVKVNVIGSKDVSLSITPNIISRDDPSATITATIELPTGANSRSVVKEAFAFYWENYETEDWSVKPVGISIPINGPATLFFSAADLIAKIPVNGDWTTNFEIFGRLKSGQYFVGKSTITIQESSIIQ